MVGNIRYIIITAYMSLAYTAGELTVEGMNIMHNVIGRHYIHSSNPGPIGPEFEPH